jgi:hypothetical protein
MFEDAPRFGTTAKTKSVEGFLEGRWAVCVDFRKIGDQVDGTVMGKLLGVDGDELLKGYKIQKIKYTVTFEPNQVVKYHPLKRDILVEGTYQVQDNGVRIDWKTYNGKPLREVMDQAKKRAETGTQAALYNSFEAEALAKRLEQLSYFELAEDRRRVVVKRVSAGSDPLAALQADVMFLERLKPTE